MKSHAQVKSKVISKKKTKMSKKERQHKLRLKHIHSLALEISANENLPMAEAQKLAQKRYKPSNKKSRKFNPTKMAKKYNHNSLVQGKKNIEKRLKSIKEAEAAKNAPSVVPSHEKAKLAPKKKKADPTDIWAPDDDSTPKLTESLA